MRVEFAHLADSAEVVGGKLYLMGGVWNRFHASEFPAPMQVAFVASILSDLEDVGRIFNVRMVVLDPEGEPIAPPVDGNLDVGVRGEGHPDHLPQRTLVAIQANLVLPRPGTYTFRVTAGESVANYPFQAIRLGRRVEMQAR